MTSPVAADRRGLVTIGEAMVTYSSTAPGPLSVGSSMRLSLAGAELTVAIAARRLGHPSVWVSRVGNDENGRFLAGTIKREGVDVSAVTVDEDRPTGVLMKTKRSADLTRVSYLRRGSAASALSPDDLDNVDFSSAAVLHITGITPALSESAADTVRAAIKSARECGVAVSFDVNYRSALWTVQDAGPVLREFALSADLVFAGPEELQLVTDLSDPIKGAASLLAGGVREVIVKDAERGASLVTVGSDGGPSILHRDSHTVSVVDPVGAGDSFVAGYLTALIEGAAPDARLRRAVALGALSVSTLGDWEGLPMADELDALEQSFGTDNVVR